MPAVPNLFIPGKASGDSLPFSWDWSKWLAVDANNVQDTIISAAITASPVGLTIGSAVIDASETQVEATIAGGSNGVSYTVNCAITTASGMIANSQEVLNVLDNCR